MDGDFVIALGRSRFFSPLASKPVRQLLIDNILILLGTALVVVGLIQRARLSPIVGYLLVGVIVGPHALGWVQDLEAVRRLGELGVIFLMFTIGLEFSLPRLLADKTTVLGLGGMQLGLTTLVIGGAAGFFGLQPAAAFAVGVALAMSSTAIVCRQLVEQTEIHTRLGHTAVGILLFQDLATIVLLLILPVLAEGTPWLRFSDMVAVLTQGAGVFFILLFLGRWGVRPFFRHIASLHSPELFMLAILLVSLGAAWFGQKAGLSLILGGFMAGMVLGETEFRHQVEADIRPFQDVLLGLFFITMGMLVDLKVLVQVWPAAVLLATGLIVVKGGVIAGLAKASHLPASTALRVGIVLAQGGEFSLVILFLALDMGLLGGAVGQVILSAVLLSMTVAPVLIRFNTTLAEYFFAGSLQRIRTGIAQQVAETAKGLESHIILCGYGRVGQNIGRFLAEENFPYIAVDLDPYRVRAATEAGEPVSYGDVTREHILHAAGLERAQAVVITFNDTRSALKALGHIHASRPDISILVRTIDDTHLEELLNAGATEVIPDALEASLTLAAHILLLLGVPIRRVLRRSTEVRADRYSLLRTFFHGRRSPRRRERLQVFRVPKGGYAVGRTLQELALGRHGVTVTAVRRQGIRRANPTPEMRIEAEDALILHGSPEALQRADRRLLTGKP
ncbi:sodium/hydrogen exchanger [Nitrosococcus halophilus Nc 4]|uniref:Sodium/hydrogen exchanger n=1 Tax=Nitrosococcus halophilus (strain Nc4) TaxID=472759 RepID=D5C224_NITHN|nr:sodium/hydrogen exchanger [Nitrosococcus halophilus Nc 4]